MTFIPASPESVAVFTLLVNGVSGICFGIAFLMWTEDLCRKCLYAGANISKRFLKVTLSTSCSKRADTSKGFSNSSFMEMVSEVLLTIVQLNFNPSDFLPWAGSSTKSREISSFFNKMLLLNLMMTSPNGVTLVIDAVKFLITLIFFLVVFFSFSLGKSKLNCVPKLLTMKAYSSSAVICSCWTGSSPDSSSSESISSSRRGTKTSTYFDVELPYWLVKVMDIE